MSYLDELGLQSYDLLIKNYINSKAGGKFTEVVTVSGTLVILEIQPNIIYSFGTVESLTIALGTPGEGSNDYAFEFTSDNNATTLSIPSSIQWDDLININPNKYYIILIHYSNSSYHGTIREWDTTNVDNRVVLIYKPSTSLSTTQIYYQPTSYGDSRDNLVAKMWVDGRLLERPYSYYQFEDTEEHSVQIEFSNPKAIPYYAFYNSSTIREVYIPDSVIAIAQYAFGGSINNLRKVSGGVNIINIGLYNDKLYDVSLYGDDLYVYFGPTFVGVNGTVPENTSYELRLQTETIATNAFKQLSGLVGITIPDNGKTIKISLYAFSETNLTSIKIYNSTIDSQAFESCSNLTSIELEGSSSVSGNAFNNCTNLASVKLNGSITLYKDSFSGCNKITSIEISNYVTFSGTQGYAFPSLPSNYTFTRVNIASISQHCGSNYCDKASYIFYGGITKPVKIYLNDIEITLVAIPDSVTTIKSCAFCRCTDITSVTLSNNLTTIGSNAFSYCPITSITFPSTLLTIGSSAFTGTSISTVTIPSSVTKINSSAFSSCANLTSVTILSSNTAIGDYAFSSCTNLSTISIPSALYDIYGSAFNSTAWYNNKSAGLVTILYVVLGYKGTTTSISINSSSYKAIANSAFYYNTSITSLTLGSYIKYIGMLAFYHCTGITSSSLTLTGVEYIKSFAFMGASITSTSLTLTNIKYIGVQAFLGCTALTSVTIGTSITEIGQLAFYNIPNLTIIINATTPPTLGVSTFNTTGLQIKVPSSKLSTYKAATGWKTYASYIVSQ